MIWIVGIGLPIVMLIFLGGWLRGFDSGAHLTNWGTGFDAGWRAREKEIAEQYDAEILEAQERESNE